MAADFFVSAARGDDSTGAGTATSPWRTIGRAIGPSPAITPGGPTRVYIEPGVYYEAFTLSLATSATDTLEIIGDCDGSGFAAGGYATPRTGIVEWCAYTDDATPGAGNCLYSTSRSYVTVRRIKFFGGAVASGYAITADNATNWSVIDCIAFPAHQYGTSAVRLSGPNATGPLNFSVERCDLYAGTIFGASAVEVRVYERSAEYDAAVAVRNCRLYSTGSTNGYGFTLSIVGGTGGKLATGVLVEHCTILAVRGARFYESVTTKPLTTPNVIRACFLLPCTTGLVAGDATHLVEDGNVILSPTPRTNVPSGASTKINYRPAVDLGDGRILGVPLRPFLEPTPGSPLAGMIPTGFPVVDLTGRSRPEGLGSTSAACGALERHDTGTVNASQADAGSGGCLELTGPASLERLVLLTPGSATLSVKVRWDGDHGDAAKPRVELLANPEIGVAGQTVTAASTGGTGSTPNAYETLTFAPIAPTGPGAVVLRFVSRSASGSGKAYFDTIGIT